ncbi:MAG: GyrI-like domain-containing protein [Candidatus Hermodarchaeota archaeon]
MDKYNIKDFPTRLTLAIRTRSPVQNLPQLLGQSYGAIMEYLGQLGESPTGHPFVIYYNLDMQDLDIEIGFPVSKKFPDKESVKSSEIPAGKYASAVHIGAYSEMESVYNALYQWVQDKGHETKEFAIELYYNDPNEVGWENTQTEVQLPLK